MEKILVTGAAGFIASKTAEKLLLADQSVVGLDNFNDAYDVRLKHHRMDALLQYERFFFERIDIEDAENVTALFSRHKFSSVVHLAGRAGVRYSMENPHVYLSANAAGTLNLLEACRRHGVGKFVLASTSSLYAGQERPFVETLPVNAPISPYAASKKAAEVFAYTYHHLFGIDVTVVRYFTVYGPAGRPDMAVLRFIRWIDEGRPIELYGDGTQSRDFTFVDDIVEGVTRVIDNPPVTNPSWNTMQPDPSTSSAPYVIYNIGNNSPVKLLDFIKAIEEELGMRAILNMRPIQPGDVPATYADVSDLAANLGYKPGTSIQEGIRQFIFWYKNYYKV